jgi:hypothetical protein
VPPSPSDQLTGRTPQGPQKPNSQVTHHCPAPPHCQRPQQPLVSALHFPPGPGSLRERRRHRPTTPREKHKDSCTFRRSASRNCTLAIAERAIVRDGGNARAMVQRVVGAFAAGSRSRVWWPGGCTGIGRQCLGLLFGGGPENYLLGDVKAGLSTFTHSLHILGEPRLLYRHPRIELFQIAPSLLLYCILLPRT